MSTRSTSLHEASHGVIAHVLGFPVNFVTTMPTRDFDGLTDYAPVGDAKKKLAAEWNRTWEYKVIIGAMAGVLAERRVYDAEFHYCDADYNDFEIIYGSLTKLFPSDSMLVSGAWKPIVRALLNAADPAGDDIAPGEYGALVRSTNWYRTVAGLLDATEHLVTRHWDAITALAAFLSEHRLITGEDVSLIVGCSTADAGADIPKEKAS